MTPSCTRGVASFGPLGSAQLHATRSSLTLVRLIFLSGLKPNASYVRRHDSHSPSGGLVSMASVTGRRLSSGFVRAGGGGSGTPGANPPPDTRGQSDGPIPLNASGSAGTLRAPAGAPFS